MSALVILRPSRSGRRSYLSVVVQWRTFRDAGTASRQNRSMSAVCQEWTVRCSPDWKVPKKDPGNVLYWIGSGVAVLAIVQAMILSVAVGNPLVPLLLGGVGVIVRLIAIGFKFILAPSEEFSTERVRFWFPVILLAAVVVPVVYSVFLQRPDALSVASHGSAFRRAR